MKTGLSSPRVGACPHANSSYLRLLLACLGTCLVLPLSAQTETTPTDESAETVRATPAAGGSGMIEGRVRNQATGRFLNNARVRIVDTGSETLTNEYGGFRFHNVPAGEQTLSVFFTGLEPQTVPVTVTSGETARLEVDLTSRGRFAPEEGEEFHELADLEVEATARDGAAIAINEQRFSGNIRNVVSADEFGDVTEGNVGEFLKFLPGISVEYVAADIRAISVRGLADSQTVVTFDGNSMASAASGSATRRFELEQVSMNNVARIELVKVPTPDMRADSLGGTVNMVSKSAFERDTPEFNYRVYANMNSEDLTFSKTPGPETGRSRKIRMGGDFSYLHPVNANLGFVFNGLYSNQFNEQHRSVRTWRSDDGRDEFLEDGTPNPEKNQEINAGNPYLQDYTFQDGPKETLRQSLGVNIDWRPADNWVVSYGLQWNDYDSFFGNRNLRWRVDSEGPYEPVSYTPTSVQGPEGEGELLHANSFRNKYGRTYYTNLDVKYFGNTITADASIYYSDGTGNYDDMRNGHFERVDAIAKNLTVSFDDINNIGPRTITTTTAAGDAFDHTDLSNYEILSVRSRPIRADDEFRGGDFNLQKDLAGPYDFKVKGGVSYRNQQRSIFDPTYEWDFAGVDGNTNADLILDDFYIDQDPHFGLEPVEWPSPYDAYELFLSNPEAFVASEDNATTEANRDIDLEETVTGGYLMGEARMLNSRLRVIGGVRWEETDFEGVGPLNDGDTLIRRGATAEGTYDDFFPSLHFTYELRSNFLLRLAYARTISRPNWNFLIPRNLIDYDEPDSPGEETGGSIEAINGELKPWYGDNFDISLEYYTQAGGIFSAGIFFKSIQDMFEVYSDTMTEEIRDQLGLTDDPRFANPDLWTVETTVNGADAEIIGFEFEVRQRLSRLGPWGNDFEVFANATLLDLQGGDNTDFSSFVERTYNWGVTYDRHPLEIMLKWNYRGEQLIGPRSNEFENGFRWYDDRLYLDINVEYTVHPYAVLFANARNVTNEPQIRLNYNDATPGYARHEQQEEYGVQLAVGLKGTF